MNVLQQFNAIFKREKRAVAKLVVQNPDGSWTGPNGEDLGGGDTNYNPDPQQSHEGDPVGVLRCGCGYMVVLRKGVSVEAAREACEAAVPAEKECRE